LRETLATPWEVDLDDSILFFEDVFCPPWQVDGMLTQLAAAGKLESVKGVVIGEMYKCDEWRQPEPWLRSRSMEDVFEHHLDPLDIPVVFNLPLGHGDHLWTLPLGLEATIDADARTIVVEEEALTPERSRSDSARAASR
jgi:muramoyltetrapeptide carboxypeptidase